MRGVHIVVATVAIVSALAGCSTASDSVDENALAPEPLPTMSASSTPTLIPTPTTAPTSAPATVPEDLLFTITATAKNSKGASVALRQDVYSPQPFDTLSNGLQKAYKGDCVGQVKSISDYDFVRVNISMTDTSPDGKAWPSKGVSPSNLFLGVTIRGMAAYEGSVLPFQSACGGFALMVPGTASATVPVPRGVAPDDDGGYGKSGWATLGYGFRDAFDGEDPPPLPELTDCEITLGPAAKDSEIAQHWPGHPSETHYSGCVFGNVN